MREAQSVKTLSSVASYDEVISTPAVLLDDIEGLMGRSMEATLSDEMRARAFNLVLQLADKHAVVQGEASESLLSPEGSTTFRLARHEDIPTICELRCAQSIEYWGLASLGETCRQFYEETEAFLRRTLNETMFFALVERSGVVVSMSGLEAADRLPMIARAGGAQHGTTIVACYTVPECRGRGHMGQMLSAWASMAPMLGIDTIFLESHDPSMQHLVQVAGYEHVSDKYRLILPSVEEVYAEFTDLDHLVTGE